MELINFFEAKAYGLITRVYSKYNKICKKQATFRIVNLSAEIESYNAKLQNCTNLIKLI